MMQLAGGPAGAEGSARQGLRMGLWGAAQAIAFGLGGLMGTGAVDLATLALQEPARGYAVVLVLGAGLFLFAAWLTRASAGSSDRPRSVPSPLLQHEKPA
jgi:BCD family chlorophyll transporter-like MFS transporter